MSKDVLFFPTTYIDKNLTRQYTKIAAYNLKEAEEEFYLAYEGKFTKLIEIKEPK